LRLPLRTETATRLLSSIPCEIGAGSGPELPIQLWTATVPATNECRSATERSKTGGLPTDRPESTGSENVGSFAAISVPSFCRANQSRTPSSPKKSQGDGATPSFRGPEREGRFATVRQYAAAAEARSALPAQ